MWKENLEQTADAKINHGEQERGKKINCLAVFDVENTQTCCSDKDATHDVGLGDDLCAQRVGRHRDRAFEHPSNEIEE